MRIPVHIGLALAAVFVAASPLAADTLKVPQDFATIQEAVDAAAAGDTVIVGPGEYTENVVVVNGKDGLTIQGKGAAIIDAHVGDTINSGIQIQSSDVTISRLTIRHAGNNGIQNADPDPKGSKPPIQTGITIDRVTIINSVNAGIRLDSVADVSIQGCTLIGCASGETAQASITIIATDNATVTKTTVRNSNAAAMRFLEGSDSASVTKCTIDASEGSGVVIFGDNALVDGTRISNTDSTMIYVEGNAATVTKNTLQGGGFIGINVNSDGATIEKNKIAATTRDSIEVEGADMRIAKNTCSGAGSAGIEATGTNATLDGNKVTDATESGFQLVVSDSAIKKNQATGCGTAGHAGFYVEGDANMIESNTARDNVTSGFVVNGSNNTLFKNKAQDNADNGILVDSAAVPADGDVQMDNTLDSNQVKGSGGEGLENYAVNTTIIKNKFSGNRLDVTNATSSGASIIDGGSNSFSTGGTDVEPEIRDDEMEE